MSDFSALQTALSGLNAHQKALQTAGHNAANAATPGYSRQRVDLKSVGGGVIPAVWSKGNGIGNGVQAGSLIRIRDEFLEARMLREVGTGAQLKSLGSVMNRVEMIFPEPSDVGLAHQLAELWGAFDDVANQPGSVSTRIALLERATTVAHELNRASAELGNLHTSVTGQADVLVSEVNSTAARVAELNQAVRNATAAGLSPHDLADERDRMIERLGELVGVTTQPGEFGVMNVYLGGTALVRGDRAEQLALEVSSTPGPTGLSDISVRWAKDGYPAQVKGGEIAGLVDGVNRAIPKYLQNIDSVAVALVGQINSLHTAGFDLDGNAGLEFFVSADGGPITASNVRLNSALTPRGVAASDDPTAPLDAGAARRLAGIGEAPGRPDLVYNELIGALGVETQALGRRQSIQNEVIRQVDDAREGVRGVNIDEEMVAMVQAQHAYSASARLMTAIDEMLVTLITRTGMVGR
ncbi:MAG: flagellar hook-associated protein FlgK [Acidimicrobiales bacterium]